MRSVLCAVLALPALPACCLACLDPLACLPMCMPASCLALPCLAACARRKCEKMLKMRIFEVLLENAQMRAPALSRAREHALLQAVRLRALSARELRCAVCSRSSSA